MRFLDQDRIIVLVNGEHVSSRGLWRVISVNYFGCYEMIKIDEFEAEVLELEPALVSLNSRMLELAEGQ